MCRSLMADPDLIKKAVQDKAEEVRPCLRCMDGCGRIFNGLPVRCAVNPVVGREFRYKEITPARDKKQVMVIGGGPAGMMAAQTLIKRGHEVTLYEKNDRLGGLLHDASAVPFKKLMKDYTAWDIKTTQESGAKIKLNTEATAELIKTEDPDAVIIATGSSYVKPQIPGIDNDNVAMLSDVENNRVTVGKKVIVCGGGLSGIECAVGLAKAGKDVSVVDLLAAEDFCKDMFSITKSALFDEVRENNITLFGNSKIKQFNEQGVVIEDKQGQITTLDCDTAVIALGLTSNNKLAQEINQLMPLNSFVIGDADSVDNIRNANFSAFNIAVEL
jgi:NADPH-dependent glutamate synthase beta subunit-like oxidoreductase